MPKASVELMVYRCVRRRSDSMWTWKRRVLDRGRIHDLLWRPRTFRKVSQRWVFDMNNLTFKQQRIARAALVSALNNSARTFYIDKLVIFYAYLIPFWRRLSAEFFRCMDTVLSHQFKNATRYIFVLPIHAVSSSTGDWSSCGKQTEIRPV